MPRNINFVRERQRRLTQLEIRDRIIFRWVLIIFTGILVAVTIAVGIRFFFVYRVNKATTEQQALRKTIGTKESVEKTFTIFSYKLKTLTELFGKRKEKQDALAYFSTLFGPDVIIRQLSYAEEDETLYFTLEAKNVFVLDEVFTKMSSTEVKNKYPTIKKESLRRSGNGKYGMNVMIALGTPKIEASPEAVEEAIP
ncbi:hypothetical protein KBC79_05785 [Candidatus Woesebacteria bacterium]|nr:hypothetical protein [Candidatus Woesebacteria bacterium]